MEAEEELHMANYQLEQERKISKRNGVILDGLNQHINGLVQSQEAWFPCYSCGTCLIKYHSLKVEMVNDIPVIRNVCGKCGETGRSICGVHGFEYKWDEGDFDVGISDSEYCPKCEE